MPQPPNRSSNCRPCPSAPVTPRTATLSVNSRTLRATLAAPPGKYDSPVTFTTGTGASGEIRDTLPQMYSSSIRSPITRMRRPANPAISACMRATSSSVDIGSGDFPYAFAAGKGIAGKRRARALAGHDDEREPGPRHQRIEPAPGPDGLIENLQHRFVDALGSEQPAVGQPGRRPGFVEIVELLDREALRLQHLARLPGPIAALVSQALVEGSEQTRALRHQDHQHAARLQGVAEKIHRVTGIVQVFEHIQAEHRVEAVLQAAN